MDIGIHFGFGILFVTSIIVILSDIPTHFCHSSLVEQVTMVDNSLDSLNNGKRAPSTYNTTPLILLCQRV